MLAFGAIFEMPLLIYFLAMVGLVTHRGAVEVQPLVHRARVHHRRDPHAGPDVVSQFMMATPMIVLYNISILLAWRVTIKARGEAEGARQADATSSSQGTRLNQT